MYYCFNGRYVSEDEPSSGRTALLKAVRRSDREPVAVKVWEKDAPEGKREAEIWKSAFPDYFIEAKNDGRRFMLVRRWIEGMSLAEYVENYGLMSPGKAVAVCLCVALRLRRFYQSTGKYYGDLRPENIILGRNSVFFVDFESAGEETEGGASVRSFTSKTLKFVSPGFAAPEVFRGRACCASDFFALGVLLNFLVSGETSSFCGKLSDVRLKEFASKCTAEKPGDRFGSVEALATELGDILRETGERPLGSLEEEIRFYLGDRMGEDPADSRVVPFGGLFAESGRECADDFEKGFESLIFSGKDGENEIPEMPESEEYGNAPDDEEESPDGQFFGQTGESPFENNGAWDEDGGKDDTQPQDGAILFPHYEKGYRRLMLYVPENISFAAELGYIFAMCFGFKTCVYEFFDYAPPRLPYYLTSAAGDVKTQEPERSGGRFFASQQGSGEADAFMASEENALYESPADAGSFRTETGENRNKNSFIQRFSQDCLTGDFEILSSVSAECARLSMGAGTFESIGEPGDDFMRCFMAGAYTNFDITVICDNMFESRGSSVQVMRYCDYVLLPVNDEADEVETAIARYTRLLGENRISKERLKIVCWEKNGSGAGAELLGAAGDRYEFAGSIGYDSDRHYSKNVEGDVYCSRMKGEIIRQYCDIASRLTYGERFCA